MVYVFIVIGFVVVCVFLLNWQFECNEFCVVQIEFVEQNYDVDFVFFVDFIGVDGMFDFVDEWYLVFLCGEYLVDEQVLVCNCLYGGMSVFEVLVFFCDVDGCVFIVDCGWVFLGDGDFLDVVLVLLFGEVDVIVWFCLGEQLFVFGCGVFEGQVFMIYLLFIVECVDGDVIIGVYGWMVSEDLVGVSVLGGFDFLMDDFGLYLFYVIQWILFVLMGFIFIGYIICMEIVKYWEEVEGVFVLVVKWFCRDYDVNVEDELFDVC